MNLADSPPSLFSHEPFFRCLFPPGNSEPNSPGGPQLAEEADPDVALEGDEDGAIHADLDEEEMDKNKRLLSDPRR